MSFLNYETLKVKEIVMKATMNFNPVKTLTWLDSIRPKAVIFSWDIKAQDL